MSPRSAGNALSVDLGFAKGAVSTEEGTLAGDAATTRGCAGTGVTFVVTRPDWYGVGGPDSAVGVCGTFSTCWIDYYFFIFFW